VIQVLWALDEGASGFEPNILTLKLIPDHLITMGGRYHHHHHHHQHHLHFTHAGNKAQTGKATCSGLPSMEELQRRTKRQSGGVVSGISDSLNAHHVIAAILSFSSITGKSNRRVPRHHLWTCTGHLLRDVQPATCPLWAQGPQLHIELEKTSLKSLPDLTLSAN